MKQLILWLIAAVLIAGCQHNGPVETVVITPIPTVSLPTTASTSTPASSATPMQLPTAATPTEIPDGEAKKAYKVMVVTMTYAEASTWAVDRTIVWDPNVAGYDAGRYRVNLILGNGEPFVSFELEIDLALDIDDYYFVGVQTDIGCIIMPAFVVAGVGYADPEGQLPIAQLLQAVYVEESPPYKLWADCPSLMDIRWQDPYQPPDSTVEPTF